MIGDLFDSGSMPVLQRLAQFTEQRHKLLVNDIANLSTPGFRPTDLDVNAFQQQLAAAIDARRNAPGNGGDPAGPLPSSNETNAPQPDNSGILFHDDNNRNLEHLMKNLAQNTMTYNASMELLRNQFQMLGVAISGRV